MLAEYQKLVNELNEVLNEYYVFYNKGAKRLDEYHLSVQQENILLYVVQNEGITVNEIAENFSITKSAVSQVLTHLEDRKFIRRKSNPDDRRETLILLGEEGKKYAHLISEADAAFVKQYFSHIEVEDLKQVLLTMKKINRVIKQSNNKA